MSTAGDPVGGGSVGGQGHTCVRPHSSLCLPLSPQALPLALLLKWGAAADVGRVKVFQFLLTEARLRDFLCFNGVPNIRVTLFRVYSVCGLTRL